MRLSQDQEGNLFTNPTYPAGFLVVLLVSPAVHQGFGTRLYLGHRILLFVIATTVGRLLKVGNEDPIRKAYTAVVSLATSTEYVPAFKTLSKPYFRGEISLFR